MSTTLASIDTQHGDMIHDVQYDYYAKRLATCSSDRTIKIFDINGDSYQLSYTLTAHEGPVWQIAWAHPRFGIIIASCSYDGTVLIHKEISSNNWMKIYEHKFHDSSVNSISWAPHEYGLILACASSDGKVSTLEYKEGSWYSKHFQNDSLGCNAVSWAPYGALGSVGSDGSHFRLLVTGSCDNVVRIWKYSEVNDTWEKESKVGLSPHTDWVRDVAWAPNSAMPYNIIASCSEDRTVYIWRNKDASSEWTSTLLKTFDAPVWRVSWSTSGNVLAVSSGDHKVTLWKQSIDESWIQISNLDDSSK